MMAPSADPFATIGLGQVQGFSKEALLESAKNLGGDEPAAAPRVARGDDRERYSARLRHLCRLIKRDRLGFCSHQRHPRAPAGLGGRSQESPRGNGRGLPVGSDRGLRRLPDALPGAGAGDRSGANRGFHGARRQAARGAARKTDGTAIPLGRRSRRRGFPREDRELGGLDRQQSLRIDGLLDVRGRVEPGLRRGLRGPPGQPAALPVLRADPRAARPSGPARPPVHPEPARGTG